MITLSVSHIRWHEVITVTYAELVDAGHYNNNEADERRLAENAVRAALHHLGFRIDVGDPKGVLR